MHRIKKVNRFNITETINTYVLFRANKKLQNTIHDLEIALDHSNRLIIDMIYQAIFYNFIKGLGLR